MNKGLSGKRQNIIEYDGWDLIHLDEHRIEVIPSGISNIDLKIKIKFCERYAKQHNKSLEFKLFANKAPDLLDQFLKLQHYKMTYPGIVMTTDSLETDLSICETSRIMIYEDQHEKFYKLRETLSLDNIEVGSVACFCEVEMENMAVGIAFATINNNKMGIFNVWVAEGFRRRGIGRCLLSAIFHWGRNSGASSAYLHVSETNIAAISLYEKLGFVEETKVWRRVKVTQNDN